MAALNQVIYGDCRSVCDTLSSFLSVSENEEEDSIENEKKTNFDEFSVGYDPSIFIKQEEINKYLCSICQHVLKDAIDIGCGNKHIFCNSCFKIYYDLNYQDHDNNYVYYGIGNEDWNFY